MFCVRLAHHSKSPVQGPLQISNDPAVHSDWLRSGSGLGNRLAENGLVAADFDELDKARAAWVQFVRTGLCNLVVLTRRGAHFIFAGTGETWSIPGFDFKASGHVVWPPTVARSKDGCLWQYRFALGDHTTTPLPLPAHLFPKPAAGSGSVTIDVAANADRLQVMSQAMNYASALPASVRENSGDRDLFRFACRMMRQPPNGFGLSIEEAWPIALMFNQRCQPAWPERRLHRTLLDAKKKG